MKKNTVMVAMIMAAGIMLSVSSYFMFRSMAEQNKPVTQMTEDEAYEAMMEDMSDISDMISNASYEELKALGNNIPEEFKDDVERRLSELEGNTTKLPEYNIIPYVGESMTPDILLEMYRNYDYCDEDGITDGSYFIGLGNNVLGKVFTLDDEIYAYSYYYDGKHYSSDHIKNKANHFLNQYKIKLAKSEEFGGDVFLGGNKTADDGYVYIMYMPNGYYSDHPMLMVYFMEDKSDMERMDPHQYFYAS